MYGQAINQSKQMMPQITSDYYHQGTTGITPEMQNTQFRQAFGPITLSNGAVYTGEILMGMKDG